MTLRQTVDDIRSLKIQGAANVAKASLNALQEEAHRSRAATISAFLKDMKKAEKALKGSRPTEPYMRNLLELAMADVDKTSLRKAKEDVHKHCQRLLKEMVLWKDTVAHIGAKKVSKGKVFIHCHSSMVMEVLKLAAKKKRFTVLNTEARPLFQGRISAKELAKSNIPVEHYVDSAGRVALKHCDIMLIGCDAVTPEGVVNKIGSAMFAEIAKEYGIPVYVCTPALKFDPETIWGVNEEIEERSASEIWEKAPKGVRIRDPAFELIEHELIHGVISELGIYPHGAFIEEVRRHYPELF